MANTGGIISNGWKDTKLFCANEHIVEMEMDIEGKALFYRCPNCKNKLELKDFERMLTYIHEKIIYEGINGSIINLKNHTWKDRKGSKFKVLAHKGSNIKIGVVNPQAINQRI